MPGAGKSTVAEAIRDQGFVLINMGDCIRTEAKKNNLELNDKNLGNLMLNLRNKFGPGAVAHLVINQINENFSNDSFDKFIIDGIGQTNGLKCLINIICVGCEC